MVLLRHLLGDALRRLRLRQGRTLREVSASARVSLGYLSEVERGQKEASSELLSAICSALGIPLSQVLREVSDNFALAELQSEPVFADVIEPAIEVTGSGHRSDHEDEAGERVPVGHGPVASAGVHGPAGVRAAAGVSGAGLHGPQRRVPAPAGGRMPAAVGRLATTQIGSGQLGSGQVAAGQVSGARKITTAAGSQLQIGAGFQADDVVLDRAGDVRDITKMVPV